MLVGDVDITAPGVSMVEIRKRIGLVFQYPEYQLFEETVAKDVAFGPKNLGLSEQEIDERVREALELVGLDSTEQIKERSPFELSGGQKRRVAIAGVVAMRPEVLILDEPTAGLDPKAHHDVLDMVQEVHRRTGNIIILVSHNMADIARVSDKIIVIDSGHLVTTGTPQEVFAQKELLRGVGLDLPPITEFTETLRERAWRCRLRFSTRRRLRWRSPRRCRKNERKAELFRIRIMIRDITLGQYYPGNSWVHKLDPRVKIIATLLFLIELFIVNDFIGFGIAAVVLGIVIAVSKVPLSFIVRGSKPILVLLLFTFALNIFMINGEVLWSWGFLHITREGIRTAVFMAVRLILLIIGSSMLTLCTRPLSLTDGIERLLSPFKKIGLPAHEIAMMMTIALRFIPTLLDETDKIMKAQQARGADFESGSIIQRAKNLIPILVPLFVSAFRIAQDLAMAMEARCYRGGDHRTRMHEMKLKGRDYAAFAMQAAFLAVVIIEANFAPW